MRKVLKLLKGKKTHLVATAAVVIAILQHYGVFTVPEELWPILGALGLSALRLGVKANMDELGKG
jgi:hypothetical protein